MLILRLAKYIKHEEKCFHRDIQTRRSGLKKQGTAELFQPTLRCLDIPVQYSFLVFDTASQTWWIINELTAVKREKFAKVKQS